ncbi:MAG: ABC transporter permease [Spirochaetaceae bacterium]|nr:MAG: ABC transporter permease [Spirochaetaceae bacterium]
MNAFFTIFRTETKLAIRDGNMLFFGVLFPVGVMLLIGFVSSAEATRLSFAGVGAIGICAAGLIGLPLTFAGYRHAGILKRFRTTPASPAVLLLAVALLQTLFAFASAGAIFLIARFIFSVEISGPPLRFILTFLFVQISIFGIGFLISALVPNTKTANLVCTVLYFPMLFLSGATVPAEIMPGFLRFFTEVFPLTQGIMLLKGAVTGTDLAGDLVRVIVLAVIAVVSYVMAFATFRWE